MTSSSCHLFLIVAIVSTNLLRVFIGIYQYVCSHLLEGLIFQGFLGFPLLPKEFSLLFFLLILC